MSNLQSFTNRLAIRLSTFSNSRKVREAAVSIKKTIENEIEILESYNERNGTMINEGALQFLAYQNGNVPATKAKQQDWLKSTIATLKAC